MKFAYMPLAVTQPSPTMGATKVRYRPMVPIHILSPLMLPPVDACLDCAADDTVFPPHMAARLGVAAANAPSGQVRLVGGGLVTVHFGKVTMLLSDGYETCEWDAVVAFATAPMRWALLGHAGFLEFFDVQLLGAKRETILGPNTSFPGQHFTHVARTP